MSLLKFLGQRFWPSISNSLIISINTKTQCVTIGNLGWVTDILASHHVSCTSGFVFIKSLQNETARDYLAGKPVCSVSD